MKVLLPLRWLFVATLAGLLAVSAPVWSQTHKPLPMKPGVPSTGSNHRLVLKDGSYQVVRKYEVVGDRVRYISLERGCMRNLATLWTRVLLDVNWAAKKLGPTIADLRQLVGRIQGYFAGCYT